jgi:hypothetical protein
MALSYAPTRVKISPVTTKVVAPKVSGHGTAVVADKILLFGGLDDNPKVMNELWQFTSEEIVNKLIVFGAYVKWRNNSTEITERI